MRYTVDFDRFEGICKIRVVGEYHRPEDSDRLKEVAVDLSHESDCRFFLVDLTDAKVVGSTMDVFNASSPPESMANSLRQLRTAFVRRELTSDDQFFETVAVNRGFQLAAFDDVEAAAAWLRGS